MNYTEKELIKEAEKRGYKSGVLIDYKGQLSGTDTLGSGEFKLKGNKLIKYEMKKHPGKNSFNRRFDTIWSKEDGWTEIATKKHGFAL